MHKFLHNRTCRGFSALAFFALASAASAQPAMSRGEQLLPITYDECIKRAEQAFVAEGWVKIGKGGAFVNAFRENHGAYIMCNAAPENKIWVNIVVASSATDSGVPGAERVKLQGRMSGGAVTPAGNAFIGIWDGLTGDGVFREVWDIKENRGQWSVVGAFYDKQTGAETGRFYTENVRFQNGSLSFRMVFSQKPNPTWPNTVDFSSVTVDGNNLRSTHQYGTGSFTRRR